MNGGNAFKIIGSWMLPHCIFRGVECQSSPARCGDVDKVCGSAAFVRYSQGLVQRCSARNEFLFTSQQCCLLLKVRQRQRRERVIDQMSVKQCLLQSTTKFRILLYRHKGYVSLHIFGSFPAALYQSFSLVFNSEPLPSSTAEQITSPSASRRVFLQQQQPLCCQMRGSSGRVAQSPAPRVILCRKNMERSYSLRSSLSDFCHLCIEKKRASR